MAFHVLYMGAILALDDSQKAILLEGSRQGQYYTHESNMESCMQKAIL